MLICATFRYRFALPTLALKQSTIDDPLRQAGDTAQRELRYFLKEEIQRISDAVRQTRNAVICDLVVDARDTVAMQLGRMEGDSKRAFDATAAIFRDSVAHSVEVAEARAIETLKGLCQDLKNRIDEIRAERWETERLAMIIACAVCGVLVGIAAIWILR